MNDATTLEPARRLGTTDLRLTPIGFGAWAIGGGDWTFGWGAQDDADSVAAIRYALELGVNWIDTAAVYGLGHSEEVVAKALEGIPDGDRPYVFTKGGLVWNPDDRSAAPQRSMAVDGIRGQVEGSLRRLGVDTIDLYQVHWPAAETSVEEYWQALVDLRSEGKLRAIGLSNHNPEQLARAEAIGHVDSLQPPFSAIHRDAAEEIAWCREHGTGVIVYSPMQSGLLTGAFSAERVAGLDDGDWRKRHPDFTTKLDANLAVQRAMAVVGERYGVSSAAVAVAWTLAWDGVSGAIVGARRPDQIDGFIAGATLALTDADLTEIATAIEQAGAGEGPTRPS
ncbi:MAG TPA: aldo/keto reductase [Conexibacter sp.]|jgi:aryl-alcohol dehydrogenase-like predicted oxidoreductase